MLFPSWAIPLCFFQIHGVMCCRKMHDTWESLPFSKNFLCYDAISSREANVLVLWGDLTKKLGAIAVDTASTMMANRYVIHMAGCLSLTDTDPLTIMPIDKVVLECSQEKSQFRALIKEARQCLRA